MPDQGRFMLDGAHFSWWMNDRAVLTVQSLRYGNEELRLQRFENPEAAAQQLARRIIQYSQRPR